MMQPIGNLVKAMAQFQAKALVLGKDKEGYGYTYVTLSKVIHKTFPILSGLGLAVIQTIDILDGKDVLVTTLAHESGEFITSHYPLDRVGIVGRDGKKKTNVAQEFGSGIAYARRYALCAILGLATDDDDAECLTGAEQEAADKELELREVAKEIGQKIGAVAPGSEFVKKAREVFSSKAPWASRVSDLTDILDQAETLASQPDEVTDEEQG